MRDGPSGRLIHLLLPDPLNEFQIRFFHALGFEDVPVNAAGIAENPLCDAPGVDLEDAPVFMGSVR